MEIREGLLYSKDHEWVRLEENRAWTGITDFAQDQLGSIVFVEVPKAGSVLKQGDVLGVVESVKAASDVYTPLGGTVLDVHRELADCPEMVNEHPYDAWFACIELADTSQLEALMDAGAYRVYCEEGH